MKKEFKFSFLCDENPMKMDDAPNNTKHCTKCERNIVDFTKFTPKQIIDYIKTNKKPCGFMRPWQEDEINKYLKDSERKSSPLYKLVKVAAIAGSPLFFNSAVAQKNNVPVETNSSIRTKGKIVTVIVLQDKDNVPLDSVDIDIYEGELLLATVKTDANGAFTLDHTKYAGKELLLKNNALGIEKNLILKRDGVCMIWKTDYAKKDQPIVEELKKFDLQFIYSDDNDKPIRNTKVEIRVFDTTNTQIETININTNLQGYSYFKTRNLGKANYFLMILDTKDGEKTTYVYVETLGRDKVTQVRVNKKFRQYHGGVINF